MSHIAIIYYSKHHGNTKKLLEFDTKDHKFDFTVYQELK